MRLTLSLFLTTSGVTRCSSLFTSAEPLPVSSTSNSFIAWSCPASSTPLACLLKKRLAVGQLPHRIGIIQHDDTVNGGPAAQKCRPAFQNRASQCQPHNNIINVRTMSRIIVQPAFAGVTCGAAHNQCIAAHTTFLYRCLFSRWMMMGMLAPPAPRYASNA